MKKINDLHQDCRLRRIFPLNLFIILFVVAGFNLNAQVGDITGPTLVCSSSAQYSLSVPSSSSVIWYTDGIVQLSSPQILNTATFSITGNGSGYIEAVVYDYYDQIIGRKNLTLWAGAPIIEFVTNEGNNWEQHVHSFAFYPYYHDSDPEYSLAVDYPGEVWNCSQGYANVYLPGNQYDYGFLLESSNVCGSDYFQFYFFN